MRYLRKILTGITVLTITSLTLTSCESDDIKIDANAIEQNVESAIEQTEIDNVSEEINDIGESIYLIYGSSIASKDTGTKYETGGRQIPECLTITKEITFDKINITLDFGDGCLNQNENYLSGKLMMAVTYSLTEKSISIGYTFDNFYFNGKHVEGEMQKMRIRIGENGNPVTTIIKNIKITWDNGESVSIEGERQREWIEGFGNKIWDDNVFSVTGTWTITKKNGVVKTAKIISPLIRKTACRFIVSGVVEIKKNDNVCSLNYGSGECDNKAVLTCGDKQIDIQLGKRRK